MQHYMPKLALLMVHAFMLETAIGPASVMLERAFQVYTKHDRVMISFVLREHVMQAFTSPMWTRSKRMCAACTCIRIQQMQVRNLRKNKMRMHAGMHACTHVQAPAAIMDACTCTHP
eukprot:364602-Chlamydomonas_euryale.AAC.6